MSFKGNCSGWSPYVKIYNPLEAGSIDGTDLIPHDNAIVRALCSKYNPPDGSITKSDPKLTLFVGRLNLRTSKQQLEKEFSQYGQVKSCCVVRDVVTGMSRGYGFVEFSFLADAQTAWKHAHSTVFHERQIVVEWDFARTMPGWIPRRLGGGLGGKKESGQLRFGGRDRPFRKPFNLPIDQPVSEQTTDHEVPQKCTNFKERHKDAFNNMEEDWRRSRSKIHNFDMDGRSSWTRNSFEEDRRKYRGQKGENSEQFYHYRSHENVRTEFSSHKNSRKRSNDYWDTDSYTSRNDISRRSSHYVEERHTSKQLKPSKEERSYKPSYRESKHGSHGHDVPHSIKEPHYRESKKKARELCDNDYKFERKRSVCYKELVEESCVTGSPSDNDHKHDHEDIVDYSKPSRKRSSINSDQNDDYGRVADYNEPPIKRHRRRGSSSDSSSSRSSSKKKSKKSKKHKKRKHKNNSNSSTSSIESKSRKHSKKKKKKSKKRDLKKDSDS